MATLTFTKLFNPTQLGTSGSPTTVYTVPATVSTTVLQNGQVRLVNTSSSVQAVTLYAVPSAGSSGNANTFAFEENIPANGGRVDVNIPQMGPGDTLIGYASAATSVTIQPMSGVLYS